jgi:hypothetical protein
LEWLERQNLGLSTASWKVLAGNIGATTDGRNLVLRILESNVLKLRVLDFKPYLKLDLVTFKGPRTRIKGVVRDLRSSRKNGSH